MKNEVVLYPKFQLLRAITEYQKDFIFQGEIVLTVAGGKIIGFSQDMGGLGYTLKCENINNDANCLGELEVFFQNRYRAGEIIGVFELVYRKVYGEELILDEEKDMPIGKRKIIFRIKE